MMQSIQLDKSGVSTSGSGGGAYSSDRRSSSSQDHFSSHGPPSSAGGSNTMMSTGKKKTDQVVLEFLYKTVEVVLLSRAYFQPSTPRRARFNLDIQELPHVRDLMRPCRDNVNEPVVLDIAMGSMLLERWQISYTNGMQSHSPLDVINQLREVCRRIGILLRSVYCLARILPAFPVSDRLKAQQEDLGHPVAGLEFEVASSDHAMQRQFESDQPKQRYSFIPIDTPFGTLQLSVLYRKRNDDLLSTIQRMPRLEPSSTPSSLQQHGAHHHDSGDANDDDEDDHPRTSLQMSSTLTHAIIQDYVPTSAHTTPTSSPHLQPSAPPVSHMSPIPAVSQTPLGRSSPMQIVHDVPNTLQDGPASSRIDHHETSRHSVESEGALTSGYHHPRHSPALSRRAMSLDLTLPPPPQYRITSQPMRIPHSANAAAIASSSSPLLHHGGIARAHSNHHPSIYTPPSSSSHAAAPHHLRSPVVYAHAHSLDAVASDFPQRHHHHHPHAAAATTSPHHHRPAPFPLAAAPYGCAVAAHHPRPADTSPRHFHSPLEQPSPAYFSPLLRHPNSAPLPRPSPRPQMPKAMPSPCLMPSSSVSNDVRFSVGSNNSQGSVDSGGRRVHPSSPPFSVPGVSSTHGSSHQVKSPNLFGVSQSPPFRGYSGELTSTSPPLTSATPPPLITWKDTGDGLHQRRRRLSLDGGLLAWGLVGGGSSGETVFGLSSQGRASGGTDMDSSSGLVDDQLCLPFATSSSSLSSTTGSGHDVMTVSAFLHELKQAPPLHPSHGRAAGRSSLVR
ncbi:hypothetical protein, variant 1 [Aphanomyces astaci]|uniref:Autophagy-related protein 13 N-terminal domain-containing protein n=1 Tax=Aphanomyces astaci TaxID=112090 RepID=W4H3H6_APHAT|nr:hypothetical protein, variant 1 [Aphanomyces astaci]ETV86457.1 hypothetical protein, variant 1 [Aphanomyces astaci]|eukprot:XP_009823257.1 hypothetical protein, variant 1 [Aphanomyces astaci]